jgi:hypothetical protein
LVNAGRINLIENIFHFIIYFKPLTFKIQ